MVELDEGRLVERIREAWGRPELTAGERAAFDARLWERLEVRPQPSRRRFVAASAVLAAAAVVVATLWLIPAEDGGPGNRLDVLARADGSSAAVASWLEALSDVASAASAQPAAGQSEPSSQGESVLAWLAGPSADAGLTALLPDEYAMLASWVAPGDPSTNRESY